MEKTIKLDSLEVKIDTDGKIKINNEIIHHFDVKGYKACRICNKNYYIHRLVAETFISNPESKKAVNHIDSNKANNNVNNLEWVTYSENMRHYHANKSKDIKYNQGENHARSILTTQNVLDIRELYSTGKYKQKDLALKYKVSQSLVALIIKRKKWQHI